ncbi:T9SS type A sorting domain-containing protein [Taibaiella lutea]|uniref:T9SS type A sorting domain-containing protein n=1 Tax=Taibaiella lutea TaxID=2608001 RepID=A0A5M6CP44_9BACT|nr:T9SS type A sorting domain-containing protein [Taibaiella lutea]KAA5536914.1 T9SS type A sorting domain-containing protein [Taibaiella lutea]
MKKMLRFLFVLTMLFSTKLFAQTDNEFWFVAPEISKTAPIILDSPVVLRITAYSSAASVTIDMPADPTFPILTPTVAANSTITVPLGLYLSKLENKPANTVLQKGLRIISTSPVTIYYEVVTGAGSSPTQDNPEIFVLKGKNALGTDFIIPSQNLLDNDPVRFNPQPYSAFDIVATEDATTVVITPSNDIVGHLASSGAFSIVLNKGETYSATASSQLAGQHLGGSTVTSDKPITITAKDDLLLALTPYVGGCGDLGGDQIVPVPLLGTQYIAMRGQMNGSGDDYVFITATTNGTQVSKDGSVVSTINAGQTQQIPFSAGSTFIETTQPTIAWQLSGIGCEVGLTQLPQINCTGSRSVSYVRSTNMQLWINLFTQTGNETNFTINGAPLSTLSPVFTAVPGTGGLWVATKVQLSLSSYPQGSVINIANSTANFHMGVLDGGPGSGTSFGYFSNYGSLNLTATATPNPACIGDNIQLDVTSFPGATYNWSGPGFISSIQSPVITGAGFGNTGIYTVDAVSSDGCHASATVNVNVIKCPKDSCIIDAGYSINFNNPYTLNFWANGNPPGGIYTWDFGDGTPPFSTSATFVSHTYPGPGSYSITIVYQNPQREKCFKKYEICIAKNNVDPKKDAKKTGLESGKNNIGELYPNPANSTINIAFQNTVKNNNLVVSVFSVEGKLIAKHNFTQKGGSETISIPINKYAPGIYIVEISNNGISEKRKFVKL